MVWVLASRLDRILSSRTREDWVARQRITTRVIDHARNGKPVRQVLLESLPAHIQARYYETLGVVPRGAERVPGVSPQAGDGDSGPVATESYLRSVSPSPSLYRDDVTELAKIIDRADGASRAERGRLARELGVSLSTLDRKVAAFKQRGIAGLLRQPRADRGHSRIFDQKVIALIQSQYLQPYRPTIASIYRAVEKDCEMSGIEKPTYGWVRAQVKKIPPDMVARFRQGEKSWDDKFAFVSLRRKPSAPRQWVDADHHPCDHYVVFPDGSIGRPWMTAFQDLCTNEMLSFCLSREKPVGKGTYPGAAAIGLGLRDAILKHHSSEWPSYGLFDHLYVDLGKDFRSKHVRAVCADLGIEIVHTRGYHGKSKPIERWFGVMETQTRHLPGWCGSNPSENPERQKIKPEALDSKKLMTIDEYEAAIRAWIVQDFHHASSKALKGLSPLEALAAHVKCGWSAREVRDERVFDLLLMKRKGAPAQVHRYGVMLFSRPFMAPELIDLIGQTVDEVRYDPARLGEVLIYKDGRFVCKATNKELMEFGADEKMLERDREIKRLQKQRLRERHEEMLKEAQYPNPLARAAAERRHEQVLSEEREKLAVNAQAESKVSVVLPKYARTLKTLSGKESTKEKEKPRAAWDVDDKIKSVEEIFPAYYNPNPWLKDD